MKKYGVVIMLLVIGCKKQVSNQPVQQYTPPAVPSCEDHPLFCEDDFDDLPESNEDTGETNSENIRPPAE